MLVFKVDRLTRSTKNLLELVELFEENNCTFSSLTESIDTDSPSGRMFLKIIGIFAEFERENLVSRLKLGFERKAKEGYTLANYHISYGYSKETGQKIQTILPHEAKIVKEIFSMYLDKNQSMTSIARTLNQRKIPTKTNASGWDAGTVKGLLTNPTYIGKVRYSIADERRYFEVDGRHKRILPDSIFYQVQEKINNMPKISRTKRPREINYFCGVLVCACCDSKFTTHNYTNKAGGDKCLYRCMKNMNIKAEEHNCNAPRISHDKMDSAFIEYIKNINDLTEIEDIEFDNDNAKKAEELAEYMRECERQIANLEARKKSITEQYVDDKISLEDYQNMMGISNEKYEALALELDAAKLAMPSENEAPNILKKDIIANIKENWDYLNNREKMVFLQSFVKKIAISVEKVNARSNSVTIEDLEFNLSGELSLEELERRTGAHKPSVRKTLKIDMKAQSGKRYSVKNRESFTRNPR